MTHSNGPLTSCMLLKLPPHCGVPGTSPDWAALDPPTNWLVLVTVALVVVVGWWLWHRRTLLFLAATALLSIWHSGNDELVWASGFGLIALYVIWYNKRYPDHEGSPFQRNRRQGGRDPDRHLY
jgi:hypothetical protein